MTQPERVHIHYHRPPDRTDVFEQDLLHDDGEVKITFAQGIRRDEPLLIAGEIILENGSDVVWFTFPGLWHDIARFHRKDGTFTGIYANVLVPCEFEQGHVWRTTDLFLDVWIPATGPDRARPLILDEGELEEALERGWISTDLAGRARGEAARILEEAHAGRWPPEVVHSWTRRRAHAFMRNGRET